MNLKDRTFIVTGASSGIGAAAARALARAGANLVLGARRQDRLQRLTEEITATGGKSSFVAGDVRDEAFAVDLVKLARVTFGGLDGAFNNAGSMGDLTPIHDMATGNWDDVIATNLTSAYFAAKHQIPALLEQGGGAIVFTSSFVGHAGGGLPGMGAYAASKAGLVGLTQSLACDHGKDNIRVNALLPGGTRTEMVGDDPDALAFIAGLHPLGRMADAGEIAEAALFLLSDASSFVTGSAMYADGGVSLKLG